MLKTSLKMTNIMLYNISIVSPLSPPLEKKVNQSPPSLTLGLRSHHPKAEATSSQG